MGKIKPKLFVQDKPLVGIDISQHGVKAMSIDTKHWSVFGYGYVAADLTAKNDKDAKSGQSIRMRQAIADLFNKNVVGTMPSRQAVISIPTSRSYSRSISLPREAEKNLEEAIRLEAEQYIPVPITELNLGYEVVATHDDSLDVVVSAAPSTLVNSMVEACQSVGLSVLMAEPSISSIARLVNHTEEGHLPTVLIDIGSGTSDIAILVDGSIRAASSVNKGGNDFTKAIAAKLSISKDKAHQLKVINGLSVSPHQAKITAAIKPQLDEIISNIRKVMRYYSERIDGKNEIAQVILAGGGSNVPGLGDYFTDNLVMASRIASPWQVLDFGKLPKPTAQYKPIYMTAAGLACVNPKEIFK